MYLRWWRNLGSIERVDCHVSPVSLVHPVISIVVLHVLKLSVRLRIPDPHGQALPGAVLFHLSHVLVRYLGPFADYLQTNKQLETSINGLLVAFNHILHGGGGIIAPLPTSKPNSSNRKLWFGPFFI